MAADDRARLTHLLDQLGGMLADLAPVLVQYRQRLIDAGMPDAAATYLTAAAQTEILRTGDHLTDLPDIP